MSPEKDENQIAPGSYRGLQLQTAIDSLRRQNANTQSEIGPHAAAEPTSDVGTPDSGSHYPETFLPNQLTATEILLAANVLSTQDPEGTRSDKTKLLADAFELALKAREATFKIPFSSLTHRTNLELYSAILGYNHLDKFKFVPLEEAARKITGLKTKDSALNRYNAFINQRLPQEIESSFTKDTEQYWLIAALKELSEKVQKFGIIEFLIEPLSVYEKRFHTKRIAAVNSENASKSRGGKKSK